MRWLFTYSSDYLTSALMKVVDNHIKRNDKAELWRISNRPIPCSELSIIQERVFNSVEDEVRPEMVGASNWQICIRSVLAMWYRAYPHSCGMNGVDMRTICPTSWYADYMPNGLYAQNWVYSLLSYISIVLYGHPPWLGRNEYLIRGEWDIACYQSRRSDTISNQQSRRCAPMLS